MTELGRSAIGTWGGGRYMRFGEAIADDRLEALFTPGRGHRHRHHRRRLRRGRGRPHARPRARGLDRESYRVAGAIGHDFIHGERQGPKGFPRFTDPALRGPDGYAGYLREAAERSLEAVGIDFFDVLLLHNPDRTGYESPAVWEGMAALRDDGLARAVGVAPGPANGFTLDLIACLERFGDVIDWAMVILNPLEPWPGELVLDAAAAAERLRHHAGGRLRRALLGRPRAGHAAPRARPPPLPAGRLDRARARAHRGACGRSAGRRASPISSSRAQWNLAHPAVACVAPTLIQEAGDGCAADRGQARSSSPRCRSSGSLEPEQVAAIRELGDNTGSMKLKGASAEHEGEDAPDRWALSPELIETGERHGIAPERDLAYAG